MDEIKRFKYLGSVTQKDYDIGGDVEHRIRYEWTERKASSILIKKYPNQVKK